MVDALASGASGLTAVKVRVLSWAPPPFQTTEIAHFQGICAADRYTKPGHGANGVCSGLHHISGRLQPAILVSPHFERCDVGSDKDSDRRPRDATKAFAKRDRWEIIEEFHDAEVGVKGPS